MINKKEIVAMLLAGGQGSRLFALTQKKAKPAVSYLYFLLSIFIHNRQLVNDIL